MTQTISSPGIDAGLLADLGAHAGDLDRGTASSRRGFRALGAAGLLGLGAPANADGRLPEMAEIVREISGVCMSTGFSLWADRMVVEFLRTAGTPFATETVRPLLDGESLGVSAMATAFKDAAGCGSLELTAAEAGGGYVVSGPIRWASNLHPDSMMVTAVRTGGGEKLVVALPLNAPGVTVGDHFDLLAMGSTASSYLRLDEVRVPAEQVLSADFDGFLAAVRPTFLVLQSAMCLGLARTGIEQARTGLTGINSVFSAEVDVVAGKLALAETTLASLAAAVGGNEPPTKKTLLSLRLTAAELATASTALEIRTAGGKGYASNTPASRRYREAAFIPVQSPSEAQLRWELAACP
ncbi:acyl-CoA dehydrogenase family protein [Amycolatopsis alkalitolerans]|uniref:Acyl-CoA dehydrogenase n=1 Tax=Amycolatopsis alkalitolerans TaxID=2547244 RepID=A0A5C4M7M2_9PSEU|nr:acyl-CoA dehydrogenase family protein [Amycolatopsis alkalitolerans]TNC28051.1 acyl-CoA dehydrogenase [Amycolatopsis alkalitolerans]